MVTTSNICAMHDQEQRGRPWTRWRGHQVQGAAKEAPASGRPASTGRPAPEAQPTPATTPPSERTSGPHRTTGNINGSPKTPDVRCLFNRMDLADVRRPADDWSPTSHRMTGTHRTSGNCLCAAAGLWPCIPSHLPLRGLDYK